MGEMESNLTKTLHFKGVETITYDAFESLGNGLLAFFWHQGMSDAVAALKTTDFLLAQLDNLSRSPEASSTHLDLDQHLAVLISPFHLSFPYTFWQIQQGFQTLPRRVCPLRFQSPLCSLLEDCLGAACVHTQLVSGRRGDRCLGWRMERNRD